MPETIGVNCGTNDNPNDYTFDYTCKGACSTPFIARVSGMGKLFARDPAVFRHFSDFEEYDKTSLRLVVPRSAAGFLAQKVRK